MKLLENSRFILTLHKFISLKKLKVDAKLLL